MPDPRLDLDDQRLIATVAATIGVPRADVAADKRSFVLHAPLELLARAALLPLVTPAARPAARERIAVLADEYERSGPPLPPPTAAGFDSHAAAAAVLADPAQHDAAATWLGQRAGPDQLPLLAGDLFLPSLEAAGHANIYLALLARYQPRGLPAGNMLRHPVHAIATGTGRRIAMRPVGRGEPVAAALAELDPIGPPSSGFIAPLVQHAESNGVLERLAGPAVRPFELLRFAAHAMLQGTADEAPYGWTHCLTLAQAPLLLTRFGCDAGAATFVAAAYLAAHWAGYGDGRVDLDHVPDPVDVDLSDVLRAEPAAAAAAVYHAPPGPERGAVAAALATAAASSHDAHRVKYTLACLDAGTCDPPAQRLYLAAAAYLNAWWERHGDESDPRPDLTHVAVAA